MNTRFLLHSFGAILLLNGFLMLFAVLVSVIYGESVVNQIFISSILTIGIGAILWFFFRSCDKKISMKEGYLIVVFSWILLFISGTFPYLFTKSIPSITNAFFESVSGYTTTGATILDNVESLPKGILFWRSLTHWIGGMGIIVLAITILPLLGIGGVQLFSAESSGIKTDKMHPRIKQTAIVLWGIYVGYTALETLLLYIAGMDFFDAINHSFSTLSSGGFSTKNLSVAYWNNNPIIQYIILFFMFLSGVNFALGYFLFTGKFQKVWKDEEFRFYLFTTLIIGFIVGFYIYNNGVFPVSEYQPQVWGKTEAIFRHAFFQVISVITTTGFISSNYSDWLPALQIVIFTLLFLGACSGSTSGGIKIVRHLLMLKNGFLEFNRSLHPNAIIPTRLNGQALSRNIMYNIMGFFVLYVSLFIFGTLLLGFLGNDIVSALSASATSLGNVGVGLGKLSPWYSFNVLSSASKWCCSFLMFVGRLELFTVLILFSPHFWKKI